MVLERHYNIRIPGYAADLPQPRFPQPAAAWTEKMLAVQSAQEVTRAAAAAKDAAAVAEAGEKAEMAAMAEARADEAKIEEALEILKRLKISHEGSTKAARVGRAMAAIEHVKKSFSGRKIDPAQMEKIMAIVDKVETSCER